jgi:hypothetical protein
LGHRAATGDVNQGDAVPLYGLAEELGEEAVATMTTGEDESEDVTDQDVAEERGGPFVVTTARTEFADAIDESNRRNVEREQFPAA